MRRIAGGLVLAGVLFAVVGWLATGWSYAVLASSSMEPFASHGDLLLHRDVPAEEVAVGDVVTVPTRDRGLVTHRVARLAEADGVVVARLQGDASPLPDPVPVPLGARVARVEVVVPRLGSVLTGGAPLLWTGIGLLALGAGALALVGRGATGAPSSPAVDPRLEALLATCEQFARDGMPRVVLADLVRVGAADVLDLPPAEHSGAVQALDDGARFYVIALTEADLAALGTVPVDSSRRREASEALDQWWAVVGRRIPPEVAEHLAPWLAPRRSGTAAT